MTSPHEIKVEPEVRSASSFSARGVLMALRRRPLGVSLVVLTAAAVSASIWFFLPLPQVTAIAIFHVASQAPAILAPTAEGRIDYGSYKQTQITVLKQRSTISNALKEPGISDLSIIKAAEPNPIAWLERNVLVEFRGNSEYMRVAIEGNNGDECITLLKAVVKSYEDQVKESEHFGQRYRRGLLKDKSNLYKDEMRVAQRQIDNILVSLGGSNNPQYLAHKDAVEAESFRQAIRDIQQKDDAIKLADSELRDFDKSQNLKPELVAAVVEDRIRRRDDVRILDAQIELAKKNLIQTETLFAPGTPNPAIQTARDKIKTLEEKRAKTITELRPLIDAEIKDEQNMGVQAKRQIIEERKVALQRSLQISKENKDEIEKKIRDSSESKIRLGKLMKEIESTESLSNRLEAEIQQIDIELGAPSRVKLTEAPYLLPGIEGNRRMKYTAMAGVGFLFLGLAGVVGWEIRARRLTHSSEVSLDLGLRFIGSIPPTISSHGESAKALNAGVLVEAVDAARTMLLHRLPGQGKMKTILITSAVPREGKTSLSGHLSISLARAGYKTLLVDGDLKSPAAHKLFDMPAGYGLCELVRDEIDLADAIRPSPVPNLSLVLAGRWDLAARQALVSDRWKAIKEQLEHQFDFLVIDTAPLLLVADTLLLAREADSVVIATLMGVSQITLVSQAVAKLKSVDAKLSGVIVNGMYHDAYHSGYGSYYQNYYMKPLSAPDEEVVAEVKR